jgi:hypothetical protein
MKLKKITALLLGAVMAAMVLTGCSQTTKSPFVSTEPVITPSPSSDAPAASAALDVAGAYAALDPKTVMLTINGNDVTWDVFFYYINSYIYQLESQGNQLSDLSEVYMDDMTYKDYILENAEMLAMQYAALEYGAVQLGVSLTDTDKAAVQAAWDERVASAGGEDAFVAQLQAGYCSKELFMSLMGMRYLFNNCFASMYGENGSKLSDGEVADNTAQDGYLMAKHILMLTSKTDDSGNEIPLSEEEKAEVSAKMEDLLKQLKGYSGDDFDTYFNGLMNEYSQDPGGLSMFPDGYLFQDGDMVSAFFDATQALEIGQFSDIVESEFGFHIIYRIPVNYDVTPMMYSNSGSYSLRYLTAQNMFSAVVDTWVNSLNVVYSDPYKSLDFDKIFAAG